MLLGCFNNYVASLCLVGELDFPLLAGSGVVMRAQTITMRFVYFDYFKAPCPSYELSYHSREFKPLVKTGGGDWGSGLKILSLYLAFAITRSQLIGGRGAPPTK